MFFLFCWRQLRQSCFCFFYACVCLAGRRALSTLRGFIIIVIMNLKRVCTSAHQLQAAVLLRLRSSTWNLRLPGAPLVTRVTSSEHITTGQWNNIWSWLDSSWLDMNKVRRKLWKINFLILFSHSYSKSTRYLLYITYYYYKLILYSQFYSYFITI